MERHKEAEALVVFLHIQVVAKFNLILIYKKNTALTDFRVITFLVLLLAGFKHFNQFDSFEDWLAPKISSFCL